MAPAARISQPRFLPYLRRVLGARYKLIYNLCTVRKRNAATAVRGSMSGKCFGESACSGGRPQRQLCTAPSHTGPHAGCAHRVFRRQCVLCALRAVNLHRCNRRFATAALCVRFIKKKIQEIPFRAAQRLRMRARRHVTFLDHSRLVVEDHDQRASLGVRGERKMSSSGRRFSENNGEMKHANIIAHATLRRKTSQWCAAQWQYQLTSAIPSYRCRPRTAAVPAKYFLLHTRAEKDIDLYNCIECYLERQRQH